MISFDVSSVHIEDVIQILLVESTVVRCILKNAVVECSGSDMHVHSLSDHELVIAGKIKAVVLNEK